MIAALRRRRLRRTPTPEDPPAKPHDCAACSNGSAPDLRGTVAHLQAAEARLCGACPVRADIGAALTAATVGGRTGLGLHGGDLAEDRSSLRPTAGCLRVRAEALEAVLALLADPARRPRFLDAVEGEP